jgi:hypothetical protein
VTDKTKRPSRNEVDIVDVTDLKVVAGVIEIPVNAKIQGMEGEVWLRFDIESAQNIIGRLTAGIVTAKAQIRRN